MKVGLLLEMTPIALARFIKFMGMPQVVDQLVTPRMLDAFMEQVAGVDDDESNPCATADDAQSATDKASDDAESAEETDINNRVKKILAEAFKDARTSTVKDYNPYAGKEVTTIDGPGVSILKDYDPKTGREVTIIDGPGVSIVKHCDPSIDKNVTIVKVFDPVTGERINSRFDTRSLDGRCETCMEGNIYVSYS